MEAYILCNLFLFDLYQRVIVVDEKGQKNEIATVNINNLGETIVDVCNKYNVNKVRLIGSESYINNVVEDINSYSITKYNNNNITIEVN